MDKKLKDKAVRVQVYIDFSPLMVKYGIYDQSGLRVFMSNVSINTPKHETVEELRKAYEALSVNWMNVQQNINEPPVRVCQNCFKIWEDHKDNCIVLKAEKWLSNHGKPEIEG